jgi:hypothetical protein
VTQPITRRQRAARTVEAALSGGLLAGGAGAVAWLAAVMIGGTAMLVLLVATVATIAFSLMRGGVNLGLWLALAAGWVVILIERWTVHGHGGLWVAGAAWVGVIAGSRRAGASKWSTPLLAYPLACAGVALAAHQSLLHPWGSSWLWIAAVLGPVVGARTLVRPDDREAQLTRAP